MTELLTRILLILVIVGATTVSAHSTFHMFAHQEYNHLHSHPESNHNSPHHKCMHDKIFNDELQLHGGDKSKSDLFMNLDVSRAVNLPLEHRTILTEKREIQKVHDVFSPIRIRLDTSAIANDVESRTCYSQGQQYKRGNPTSTNVICNDNSASNCWGTCQSGDVVTAAKQSRVLSLVNIVKAKIEAQLTTRRLTVFTVPATQAPCGAEGGVAPTSSSTAAWAMACIIESTYKRPIAGQLNINPAILDIYNSASNEHVLLSTLEHEVTHILGFSASMYSNYVDSNGNNLGESNVVATRQSNENGVQVSRTFFIHPTLRAMFQKITGCSSPVDVPIEEYGNSGSAGSHFDSRVFMNELMAPSLDGCQQFGRSCFTSVATLTLLQVTGWYQPNLTNAIEPTFGKNMGCSFATDRCNNWDTTRKGYYCTDTTSKKVTCAYHLRDKGVCDIVTFTSNLPAQYRYFSNPAMGGRVSWFDFCPLIRRYIACNDKTMPRRSSEVFNSNSACFEGNLELNGFSGTMEDESSSSRCLVYSCDKTRKILRIRLHTTSQYVDCPADQSYLKITSFNGFKGSIACPKLGYTLLCEAQEIAPSTDDGTGQYIDPNEAGNEKSDGTTNGKTCFFIFCWGGNANQTFKIWSTHFMLLIGIVLTLHMIFGYAASE
ncbi:hypothetical protein C9374_007391 [Naegleria lovaniensis]|uniref:leishmanolysin n=1 Tax=Naegleria lovaniensis TaxID=51637 RepID=A0AA88GGY7_NAELO|nr:uncharacterized protein C9374_007391 [Naegleria lovaniensis]KAG2379252.1 hypothetical protein C9374_007391 [Naegleria lovaniensis]